MDNVNGHVMNLANSIIGVSILAMPYCFKQCGIILSILMLLISSIISRLTCHFLLKSAILARRKTFEFLAFHIFGLLGKFSIEVGMIGFLLGTCIAFFVVMGDLGPAIISEMTGVPTGNALRNSILVALAIFCVLPLGLLRNVDSLNGVSKATIGFYCCLVLKIIIEALPHIFTGDWTSHVILWRPAGILQCLPIFSMALFCQTQIFEIYQALPNASLDKMNNVIRIAVNICTWVYIFVGTFGYIAFFQKPFTGNILLSFKPSAISDMIKIGFVLSLAFSFPLVIFPCRASLYSLLYKGPSYTSLHEGVAANYIPEGKFKMLTLIVVFVSLAIGLLIPTIELVLGLMGSTIGVMICVLFPVTCFICISPKNTNERILAQIMLFIGVIVMVLGTYANLYAFEEAKMQIMITEKPVEIQVKEVVMPKFNVIDIPTTVKIDLAQKKLDLKLEDFQNVNKDKNDLKEVRHEPPQPEEPVIENQIPSESPKNDQEKKAKEEYPKEANDKQMPVVEPVQPQEEKIVKEEKPVIQNKLYETVDTKIVEGTVKEEKPVIQNKIDETVNKKIAEEKQQDVPDETKKEEMKEAVEKIAKKNDEVDSEAIKKEESELKEQEKEKFVDKDHLILIDTIQKQNEVQKEIVEQQKKLIQVIQQQQDNVNNQNIDKVNEEKVKAVKNIEDIARKAIESISGQETKKIAKAEKQEKPVNDFPEENKVGEPKVEQIQLKEEKPEEKPVQKEVKNEASKINLLPLPIALAKINNATFDTKQEESSKNNLTIKKDQINKSAEDAKAMRRDILAEDDSKKRVKRDADIEENVEKVKKLNQVVKEVCNEMNKLTSTEKPIIKMLCKLSEPEFAQVGVKTLEKENTVDVNPHKRDLKEYTEK